MRRTLIVLVLAVSGVAAVTAAAFAAAAATPIVSPIADPYYHDGGLKGTKGFGQVKPPVIFYGGDPTGLVCRIRWVSWGGPDAHGYGTGWYINSNQSVNEGHLAVAIVVASKAWLVARTAGLRQAHLVVPGPRRPTPSDRLLLAGALHRQMPDPPQRLGVSYLSPYANGGRSL